MYKTVVEEEWICVCDVLRKYLTRRLKYQDAEAGGILGMSDGVITHYYHDHYAQGDRDRYLPASNDLNWIIGQWRTVGIEFAGLIHAHPDDRALPSSSDMWYVSMLLTFNPQIPFVLLGIVSGGRINFFRFERDFLPFWREYEKNDLANREKHLPFSANMAQYIQETGG